MFAEFWTDFTAASAANEAYIAGLPQWVRLWVLWMNVVFTVGFVAAIVKVEARWLALAMVLTVLGGPLLTMYQGAPTDLWGLVHVILWTPVAVYFVRRWPHVEKKSVYGVWFTLALATLIVSLVFDVNDVRKFLMA